MSAPKANKIKSLSDIQELAQSPKAANVSIEEFMSSLWSFLCRNKKVVRSICVEGNVRLGLGNAYGVCHDMLFRGIAIDYGCYNSYV